MRDGETARVGDGETRRVELKMRATFTTYLFLLVAPSPTLPVSKSPTLPL